jgi:hypothetical protein
VAYAESCKKAGWHAAPASSAGRMAIAYGAQRAGRGRSARACMSRGCAGVRGGM